MSENGHGHIAAHVPRGTIETLQAFVGLLREEASRQNLIARSTLDAIWERHILDSWQLIGLAPAGAATWVDIGSGAGLPGLVIAIASDHRVTCIEPRRLRADFLQRTTDALGLSEQVTILAARSESCRLPPADIVSARAVAPLERLFAMAAPFTAAETLWLLPKGRAAQDEVAETGRTWQGDLRLVPSLSDPASSIVVARNVRRREPR